jgi:plasmid maintenance system antidote protein VapI
MTAAEKARQDWLKSLLTSKAEGVISALSDKLRMDPTSVSLMVHGKRPISEKMAVRIANRLHVSLPEGMSINAMESNVAPAETTPNRTEELLQRILKAQEEQSLLIKTLTELVIERKR